MMVITQLIYLHPGHEQDFLEFEAAVLPLLPSYGGELLLRVRPDPSSFVAGTCEPPYEIHLVQLPDEAALASYLSDPIRQRMLALKDRSIRAVVMIQGART